MAGLRRRSLSEKVLNTVVLIKVLPLPKRLSSKHLHGIIEFDETYFIESHQGEYHLNRNPENVGG